MTQAYPLSWPEGWPRTPEEKREAGSRFKTTFTRARTELFDELRRMGATHVVVSSWLPIRNDGLPYADSARRKIEDPGVAVYFQWHKKPMVIARDAYWNVHDNLRSIGLAIGHLRGMERHGGAHMMERSFEGFAQLAAPDAFDPWAVLGLKAGASRDDIEAKFRALAKLHHPDMGGNASEFHRLQRARERALQ
jgi:hypothetical protein